MKENSCRHLQCNEELGVPWALFAYSALEPSCERCPSNEVLSIFAMALPLDSHTVPLD